MSPDPVTIKTSPIHLPEIDKITQVKKTKILFISKKAVALSLILFSLYGLYVSIKEILFVLPQISFMGDLIDAEKLYIALLKKAIIVSSHLFIDSIYGFSLLIKPMAATKNIHIILGIVILIISFTLFKTTAIDSVLNQLPILPIT